MSLTTANRSPTDSGGAPRRTLAMGHRAGQAFLEPGLLFPPCLPLPPGVYRRGRYFLVTACSRPHISPTARCMCHLRTGGGGLRQTGATLPWIGLRLSGGACRREDATRLLAVCSL